MFAWKGTKMKLVGWKIMRQKIQYIQDCTAKYQQ